MPYVDGFVIPLPKKNTAAYRRMARQGGRAWKKYGALDYWECIGDDLDVKMGTNFRRAARAKAGETVIFAWIVYKSRAHRDRVVAKVMADADLAKPKSMPFDMKRMVYGGFKVLVKV